MASTTAPVRPTASTVRADRVTAGMRLVHPTRGVVTVDHRAQTAGSVNHYVLTLDGRPVLCAWSDTFDLA